MTVAGQHQCSTCVSSVGFETCAKAGKLSLVRLLQWSLAISSAHEPYAGTTAETDFYRILTSHLRQANAWASVNGVHEAGGTPRR